jgi:DnaK suppressor protein
MVSKIKEKLEAEKQNILQELAAYKIEDPLSDPEQSVSNSVDDAVTVSEGHERIVATRLELKQRLAETVATLRKIDEGMYGVCETCGEKISEGRLEALPTARECLECQSKRQ